MSGEGPEAIPTSADPKSHRPTKKRALTPSTAQSASIDALFARPEQEIRVPASGGNGGTFNAKRRALAPDIVPNAQGSSAGAGSGEFHVYKASRRREYERLRDMDEEAKKEKSQEEYDKERLEREKMDEEKTRKNREKREKMKARKGKKGKGNAGGSAATSGDKSHSTANAVKITARKDGSTPDEDEENHAGQNGKDTGSQPDGQPIGLVIHDDD